MRKPSTPGPAAPSTRDRVLSIARDLFNDTGTERTTTRAIAEAAGINEGNLYYHFRTKEALVLALFDRFEAEADVLFETAVPGHGPRADSDPSPYSAILRRWFLMSWAYRFLFRDVLFLRLPALEARLRRLSGRLQDGTRRLFEAMGDAGLIAIEAEALDRLLANLWIVSSYWISYLVLHGGSRAVTPDQLRWGQEQVRSLYAPYLTAAARDWMAAHPVPEGLAEG